MEEHSQSKEPDESQANQGEQAKSDKQGAARVTYTYDTEGTLVKITRPEPKPPSPDA